MSFSMYQASVPLFLRQLAALSEILKKGEAFAKEKGIDPQELLDARLAPDMLPFPNQIQIASDAAKGAVSRLAGVDMPSFPDTEKTFAELQERVANTIAFVKSVPAEAYEGSESREVVLKAGAREFKFTGESYLMHFVLPNFLFHVTTAYGLLRGKGVPLSKMDYLGGI